MSYKAFYSEKSVTYDNFSSTRDSVLTPRAYQYVITENGKLSYGGRYLVMYNYM